MITYSHQYDVRFAVAKRDHSLDHLLDLHGMVFVVDEKAGHWVKFEVRSVPPSIERPHGLNYSLTLHNASGERLVGFDNAHNVEGSRDHRHVYKTVKPYEYKDAATLLEDFWSAVEKVLTQRGVQ